MKDFLHTTEIATIDSVSTENSQTYTNMSSNTHSILIDLSQTGQTGDFEDQVEKKLWQHKIDWLNIDSVKLKLRAKLTQLQAMYPDGLLSFDFSDPYSVGYEIKHKDNQTILIKSRLDLISVTSQEETENFQPRIEENEIVAYAAPEYVQNLFKEPSFLKEPLHTLNPGWCDKVTFTKIMGPKGNKRIRMEIDGHFFHLQMIANDISYDSFLASHDFFQHGWPKAHGFIVLTTVTGEGLTTGVFKSLLADRIANYSPRHLLATTDVPKDALDMFNQIMYAASEENEQWLTDYIHGIALVRILAHKDLPIGTQLVLEFGRPFADRYFCLLDQEKDPKGLIEMRTVSTIVNDLNNYALAEEKIESLIEQGKISSFSDQLSSREKPFVLEWPLANDIESTEIFEIEAEDDPNYARDFAVVKISYRLNNGLLGKELISSREYDLRQKFASDSNLKITQVPYKEGIILIYREYDISNTVHVILKHKDDKGCWHDSDFRRIRFGEYSLLTEHPSGFPYRQSQILSMSLNWEDGETDVGDKAKIAAEFQAKVSKYRQNFIRIEDSKLAMLAGEEAKPYQASDGSASDPRRKVLETAVHQVAKGEDPEYIQLIYRSIEGFDILDDIDRCELSPDLIFPQ